MLEISQPMRPPVEEKQQESTPQQYSIGNRLPENNASVTIIELITGEAEANTASDTPPPVTLMSSHQILQVQIRKTASSRQTPDWSKSDRSFRIDSKSTLPDPEPLVNSIPPFLSTKGLQAALEELENGEDRPRRKRGKNTEPHGGKG